MLKARRNDSDTQALLGGYSNVLEALRSEGVPPPACRAVMFGALRYLDAELLNALMLRRDCCSTSAVRALKVTPPFFFKPPFPSPWLSNLPPSFRGSAQSNFEIWRCGEASCLRWATLNRLAVFKCFQDGVVTVQTTCLPARAFLIAIW